MNDKLQQVSKQTKRMSKKQDNSQEHVPQNITQSLVQKKTISEVAYHAEGSPLASENVVNTNKRDSEGNKKHHSEELEQSARDTVLKLSSDITSIEDIPSKIAKLSEDFVPVPAVSSETDVPDLNVVQRISSGEVEELTVQGEFLAVGVVKTEETIPPSLVKYISPLEHFKRQENG